MPSSSRLRNRTPGFAEFTYKDKKPSRTRKRKRPHASVIPEVATTRPTTSVSIQQKSLDVAPTSSLPISEDDGDDEWKPETQDGDMSSSSLESFSKPRLSKRVTFSEVPQQQPIEEKKERTGRRRGGRQYRQGNATFLDVDWMSNAIKWDTGTNRKERSLDYQANRTMYALLLRREQDVTRHIAINGDSGVNRLTPNPTTSRLGNLRLWPNTDYYQAIDHESIKKYRCLGLNMHERDSQFIDISLEEPGMEWDARELRYLDEGSDVELDPHVDIADTRVNGGIGLVIQQESGGNSTNKPTILTKQQLIRPYLQAPRYNRAPLPDELKQSIDLSEYQPIIDMLRAQLGTLQKPSDKSPLSDFVSRTVAEEAVSGAVKTWTKIKHFRTNIDGSPRRLLGASSNISQWIGVLESALAAGLPPEVIARSYHRLEKICDVFPELNRPLNQTASSMHWRR